MLQWHEPHSQRTHRADGDGYLSKFASRYNDRATQNAMFDLLIGAV
jgi:hypothetical protein